MTLFEASQLFRSRLGDVYPSGEREAMWRIVLEDVLGYLPVDAVLREQSAVPEFFAARLDDITRRLLAREPLQYVLGTARFHGHTLRVTPDTLIPRPETEQLVDLIIDREGNRSELRVLDACTGSGCIAVSLARAMKFPTVMAFDISAAALRVARENAERMKCKVDFFQADMYDFDFGNLEGVDVLVSNPPYITEYEWSNLEPNVRDYEPAIALVVPTDRPLKPYEALVSIAPTVLRLGARVYLEVDASRAADVAALLRANRFDKIETITDFRGNRRFVFAVYID